MKKKILISFLLLSSAMFSQTAAPAKSSPVKSLEWLIGGVWTADMSKMGGGMKSIETRYTWSDNHTYVRFNTHFISDKGTANTYDGNFYWDRDRNALTMWYMSADDTIYTGPIVTLGDLTTFDFRGEDFEGKLSDLRVVLTRKSDSLYNWALSERDGDKWKPLATLDYSRSKI